MCFTAFVLRDILLIVVGYAVTGVICTFINASPNKRVIGYAYHEQIRDICPAFLLSAVAGAAAMPIGLLGLPDIATVALQVVAMGVVYLAVARLFRRGGAVLPAQHLQRDYDEKEEGLGAAPAPPPRPLPTGVTMSDTPILVTRSSMPPSKSTFARSRTSGSLTGSPTWARSTTSSSATSRPTSAWTTSRCSPTATARSSACSRPWTLHGKVITTPYTFASTTHAIVRKGLTPVFADIRPDDYTLDPERVEELVDEETCAIVPVHVYGNLCDRRRHPGHRRAPRPQGHLRRGPRLRRAPGERLLGVLW